MWDYAAIGPFVRSKKPNNGEQHMFAQPRASATSRAMRIHMHARLLHFLHEEHAGSSLVEMAVSLPVLLLIVTGILTFGIAINNYITLTDATNVAARQLAISRGQTTDPCSLTASAVYAAAPILKQSNFTFSFVFNGTPYTGTSCSSASISAGAAGNLVQGGTALVTVTYPCSLKVYGASYVPGCTLQAQTAELVQ